jgi:hypothetical protein
MLIIRPSPEKGENMGWFMSKKITEKFTAIDESIAGLKQSLDELKSLPLKHEPEEIIYTPYYCKRCLQDLIREANDKLTSLTRGAES